MPPSKVDELSTMLLELLRNDDFRSAALPRANFWSIIHYGEASYENRYNRVFRWLLDPAANHGLGANIANALLRIVDANHVKVGMTRVDTRVETSTLPDHSNSADKISMGRIDITLDDRPNELFLAIECKMKSSQHGEQLTRYREWVQRNYGQYKVRYFIFLTEQPEIPEDSLDPAFPGEEWVNVTFADFASAISQVLDEAGDKCSHDAQSIIRQFLADQRRRSAPELDQLIDPLHRDMSGETTFADLLGLALQNVAGDSNEFAKDLLKRKVRVGSLADTPDQIRNALVARFEDAGYSSSDLDSVLQLCWDHRPSSQDHSKNPETMRIIKEFAETVAGSAVEPGTGSRAKGMPDLFCNIALTKGGQAVHLTLHDGNMLYLAGNKDGEVPAVLHHYRGDDPKFRAAGCIMNQKTVKQDLSQNHGNSGAQLAANFVEYLREKTKASATTCGCGLPFITLVPHKTTS